MTPAASSHPYEEHGEPSFKSPVLLVFLEGWVDASLGASTAATTMLNRSDVEDVVTFSGARFLDQRARRPVAHIVNGVTTSLAWPVIRLRAGHDPSGSEVLFLVGPEPDFFWREFVSAVVELTLRYGVRMVVGLGAFPAPAPHTRPIKLAATAPEESAELAGRVGIVQGELEVPAGIVAALELGMAEAGVEAVTLWARVPHYVSAMPFPEAGAALIDGVNRICDLHYDAAELRAAADSTRQQVDRLIAANSEHLAMVRKLEEAVDASEGNPLGIEELPSADELAAELERFLRGEHD